MPIYDFECEACGARFERLVDAGTESVACEACGAARTRRVYSAIAEPFHLVKTPREMRKQERRNAKLKQATKARFKQMRQRAREAQRARRQSSGGGA